MPRTYRNKSKKVVVMICPGHIDKLFVMTRSGRIETNFCYYMSQTYRKTFVMICLGRIENFSYEMSWMYRIFLKVFNALQNERFVSTGSIFSYYSDAEKNEFSRVYRACGILTQYFWAKSPTVRRELLVQKASSSTVWRSERKIKVRDHRALDEQPFLSNFAYLHALPDPTVPSVVCEIWSIQKIGKSEFAIQIRLPPKKKQFCVASPITPYPRYSIKFHAEKIMQKSNLRLISSFSKNEVYFCATFQSSFLSKAYHFWALFLSSK